MIRYLETRFMGGVHTKGRRVLFRLDSIKEVGEYDSKHAVINGKAVDLTFEEVKNILESDDHRQIVDYENWPPPLLYLARNRVCDAIKLMGPEKALAYLKEVVNCTTDLEAHKVWMLFTEEEKEQDAE